MTMNRDNLTLWLERLSMFANQIQAWLVFEVGADTTFSYTCPPTIGTMPTSPED